MNSEKRFLLAVVLSFLILVLYPVYLKWVTPPKTIPDQESEVVKPGTTLPAVKADEIHEAPDQSAADAVKDNRFQFSHRFYEVEFSDLGGVITKLTLKDWGKPGAETIPLIDSAKEHTAFLIDLPGQGIDVGKVRHSLKSMDEIRGKVVFAAEIPGAWRMEKTYQFDPETPQFDLKLEVENLVSANKTVGFGIHSQILAETRANERHFAQSYTQTHGKLFSTQLDKTEKTPKVIEGKIEWNALTRKYFAVIVKPGEPAALSKTGADAKPVREFYNHLKSAPQPLAGKEVVKKEFSVFAGPQYQKMLKAFGAEDILFQGFFGIFKLWLLASLVWVHGLVGNYGWAIIIVTIFIKILFTPLTHMSFESMRKMQAIQPKVKALQERYKEDKAKQSREMMELYRKHKINPMAGCLPMLLQIPIFIAFYNVLGQTVELSGSPFIWWIKDLSTPDRLFTLPFSLPVLGDAINLLPILMIGSMIWQQKLTPQTGPADQQMLMMIMPVIFGFIFYGLPSGLVLYWFVNNMLTIFHQLFIKGKALPHHEKEPAIS